MLIAVSIASAWLLWLGLCPSMYSLAGFSLVIMLWGGVLAGCLIISITSLAVSGSVARGTKTTIEERAFLIIPLVTTLLLAFQIPLRLGCHCDPDARKQDQ